MKVDVTGSNPQDTKTPGSGDVNALLSGFNGTSWDRWRNNTSGTLLASAARTSNTASPNQTNHNARGIIITLDITAAPATPVGTGIGVAVLGLDPVTGKNFLIGNYSPSKNSIGTFSMELYPGINLPTGVASNSIIYIVSAALPRTWFVYVSNNNAADSFTYSVGYSLIL